MNGVTYQEEDVCSAFSSGSMEATCAGGNNVYGTADCSGAVGLHFGVGCTDFGDASSFLSCETRSFFLKELNVNTSTCEDANFVPYAPSTTYMEGENFCNGFGGVDADSVTDSATGGTYHFFNADATCAGGSSDGIFLDGVCFNDPFSQRQMRLTRVSNPTLAPTTLVPTFMPTTLAPTSEPTLAPTMAPTPPTTLAPIPPTTLAPTTAAPVSDTTSTPTASESVLPYPGERMGLFVTVVMALAN
jgi:hypothetical protein